jgi:hypothetical protein
LRKAGSKSNRFSNSGDRPGLIADSVKGDPQVEPLEVMMGPQSRGLPEFIYCFTKSFRIYQLKRSCVMRFGVTGSQPYSHVCRGNRGLNKRSDREKSGSSGPCGICDQAITEENCQRRQEKAKSFTPSELSFKG